MFSIMTTSFQHNCLQINISNLSGLSAKIDKNSLIQVGLKYVYTSHKLAMDWKVKLNNFPFIAPSSAHFRILLLTVELLDRCLSLFLFVGFKVKWIQRISLFLWSNSFCCNTINVCYLYLYLNISVNISTLGEGEPDLEDQDMENARDFFSKL